MSKILPIETHPLKPFLPVNARILMLGSFPPQKKRWNMDFYYPNLQNDMWRIFGLVFFNHKNHFLNESKKAFNREQIIDFLNEKGVAIYDTASAVIRQKENASDQFLEIVTPSNIDALLSQIPHCQTIVTTGQKATDTLRMLINADEPKVGGYTEFYYKERPMRLYRMPSSSRAYPKSLVEKAETYNIMFRELNFL